MKLPDLPLLREFVSEHPDRAAMAALGLWAVLLACVWLVLTQASGSARERIADVDKRYARAAPLVREVAYMKAQRAEFESMEPLAAARKVTRDLTLDAHLAAIRPTPAANGSDGIQMVFESLNLPQTLDLLKNLRDRVGLQVVSCSLNKRMDNPALADMQLILVR
ncbi:hypothetical protein GGQ74_002320 [Desulfobaculum xiamenense]|uniref:Uncharacterized protein n=1 Tax=Desulfobaculum xiamenense TaxID=995050 RepID=A0A846QN82_9BACT|nr:type II secretion system protein M [Desulfobaculum xiamenense]NJB68647.1 hypothetical protein [Desulfobaculum xiamenense]